MLKVNLHNHLAPDFDSYWLWRAGLANENGTHRKNLAEVMVDKSLKKRLTVNAITDEFFAVHPAHSKNHRRFEMIWKDAQKMSKGYTLEGKEGPVISIRKNDQTLYLLNSQSIWINEGGRSFKMLTFGQESPLREGQNLQDTLDYLSERGLPAIPIYPLSPKGMGEELFRECCVNDLILASESESQMCLPFPAEYIPPFNQNAKAFDKKARRIASEEGIPIISSDGANWPTQIGAGYNLFPSSKLNLGSGRDLVKSLVKIIKDGDSKEVQHYLNPWEWKEWAKWTLWEYGIKEQALGTKEKFYENMQQQTL